MRTSLEPPLNSISINEKDVSSCMQFPRSSVSDHKVDTDFVALGHNNNAWNVVRGTARLSYSNLTECS